MVPVVDGIHQRLTSERVLPKASLGNAIQHPFGLLPSLKEFGDNHDIPLLKELVQVLRDLLSVSVSRSCGICYRALCLCRALIQAINSGRAPLRSSSFGALRHAVRGRKIG